MNKAELGFTLALSVTVMPATSTANAPPGRYTVTAATVHDNRTKLTWQRAVPPETYDLYNAGVYCSNLTLGSQKWRLPTVVELQSIVDYTQSSPAIDSAAFPNTPSNGFWSSSDRAPDGRIVNFADGATDVQPVRLLDRVRCVR